MEIYREILNVQAKNPSVTVGTFDGLHKGHQELLSTLKETAATHDSETVVFTFWPHPRMVLGDTGNTELLNTLDEKISLFEQSGIDHLVIYPFTKIFSQLTARDFVKELLVNKIGVKQLVVGFDHLFGRNREGSFDSLEKLGDEFGFQTFKQSEISLESTKISSTMIRSQIKNGDIDLANQILGYQYMVSGNVADGYKVGRKIGFPTANVVVSEPFKLVPGNGVYAVWVKTHNTLYKGMLNIGIRPTVNNDLKRTIEVHILDFEGDLYNNKLEIRFVKKIRDEIKFEGLDKLVEQLVKDRKCVSEILTD